MTDVNQLIIEHLDIWTSATEKKSGAGRGNGGTASLFGIKKLRELILELAVRGKLVPQSETKENAADLIKTVELRRLELIGRGRIKNQKALLPVSNEEARFVLPVGWEWTRLTNLAEISPRNDVDDDVIVSFVPMPEIFTGHAGEHGQEIRRWKDVKKSYTHFANGDIALAKITPCFENSKAAIFSNLKNGVGAGTTELHVARLYSDAVFGRFILLHLKAPSFIEEGKKVMTGSAGQKRVPRWYFTDTPIALPPVEEQHRIVAKVDELMGLCDALERQAEDSLKAHRTLVETCLATLTNSQTPEELSENWTRLETHFDTLFTTQESVNQLVETVVCLAVQGKLEEHRAADEPFMAVADVIRLEKEKLARLVGSRKKKPIPDLDIGKAPFDIPISWQWARLDDVVDISGGITKGRKLTDRNTVQFPYLRVANVQRGYLELDEIKTIELPVDEVDKYQLREGDLLITEGGDWDKVGRTAIWRCESDLMGHQNHVFRARKLVPYQLEEWFELYLNCSFAREYFSGASKQTTNLASINMTQLRNFMVPMPPFEEQRRILQKVQSLKKVAKVLRSRISDVEKKRTVLADTLTSQIH